MTTPPLAKQAQDLRARFFERGAFPIKSGGPIFALDWDGPVLRAAHAAAQKGKSAIVRHAVERLEVSLDFAKLDAAAAGAALAQALHRLKIKPGAVVMGIPRGQVFLRTLLLPKPATAGELTSMVYFQISKDIPFRADEAVIDFQINDIIAPPSAPPASPDDKPDEKPAPAQEQVEVLVAVVRKEAVAF